MQNCRTQRIPSEGGAERGGAVSTVVPGHRTPTSGRAAGVAAVPTWRRGPGARLSRCGTNEAAEPDGMATSWVLAAPREERRETASKAADGAVLISPLYCTPEEEPRWLSTSDAPVDEGGQAGTLLEGAGEGRDQGTPLSTASPNNNVKNGQGPRTHTGRPGAADCRAHSDTDAQKMNCSMSAARPVQRVQRYLHVGAGGNDDRECGQPWQCAHRAGTVVSGGPSPAAAAAWSAEQGADKSETVRSGPTKCDMVYSDKEPAQRALTDRFPRPLTTHDA
ncbi:hypothetical protein HPB51_019199 [Rhipicephalus microplus]|uniref:Uncharacterized protein n=1 Tax=Rhipicephalus microplus TaxID=6941 RepID=A0A9J6EB53_RHIMP|nr:hypothetical protein HPB51_019199 [Rhipicephalus microplus]